MTGLRPLPASSDATVPAARPRTVETVLGPVPVENLGIAQAHEHLFCEVGSPDAAVGDGPEWRHYSEPIRLSNYYDIRRDHINADDQRLVSVADAIAEVAEFRRHGGGTIVDVTPRGLGRAPVEMRAVSSATGVHVVMGCGYYVHTSHPPGLAARGEDDITAEILAELRDGVDGTGIRPGVIGEIGMSWPPTREEISVLRAAARAQSAAGVGLVVHPGRSPEAPRHHLGIIEEAGGDITRCVISHVDRTMFSMSEMRSLARTGCYVEFDLFGVESSHYSLGPVDLPNDALRVDYIRRLLADGHGDRILISHDICNKSRLTRYGGEGYAHILTRVVPLMRRKGLAEEDIDRLLVHNPAALLVG